MRPYLTAYLCDWPLVSSKHGKRARAHKRKKQRRPRASGN